MNAINLSRQVIPVPQAATAEPRIAVLVPCYNEEVAVERVVRDFQASLPQAEIYVYDNNSRDRTQDVARAAGAIVRLERRQGKGNVVRRMFADIDADIYVLVDGDATYDASSAPAMVQRLLDESLDMVVGCRVHTDAAAYRSGHQTGNAMLTGFVARLFGRSFTDILSGYRVFSRRFVKSFPALSKGFETETELTVHALELRMPVSEIETPYGARLDGSVSKLSTYRDGFRILRLILALYKHERPLLFFSIVAVLLSLIALGFGTPVVLEWLRTGLVPRFPTAILATGIMIMACLTFTVGLVLETVTRGRQEFKRLMYLQVPLHRWRHRFRRRQRTHAAADAERSPGSARRTVHRLHRCGQRDVAAQPSLHVQVARGGGELAAVCPAHGDRRIHQCRHLLGLAAVGRARQAADPDRGRHGLRRCDGLQFSRQPACRLSLRARRGVSRQIACCHAAAREAPAPAFERRESSARTRCCARFLDSQKSMSRWTR
jgi:glycosyltransferase involved in cell wall biosynthesis